MVTRIRNFGQSLVQQPLKLLVVGSLFTLVMLTFDGSLWRYWSLHRGQEDMAHRVIDLARKSKKLEFKIHQANQMTYIERQATDQFDYVREGDLIFVFAE